MGFVLKGFLAELRGGWGNAVLWPGVLTSRQVLRDSPSFTRQGILRPRLFVRHGGEGPTPFVFWNYRKVTWEQIW